MRSRRLLAAAALLTAIPAAGCVAYPDSYGYYDDGYYSSSYDDDYYDGYWGYYARDGYYRRGSYYYNNAYPGYTFGNGGYWYGGSWYSRPIVIVNHNDRHNGRHDRWRHDGNRHDRDRDGRHDRDGDRDHHRRGDNDRNWGNDRDGDRDGRPGRSYRTRDDNDGQPRVAPSPRGPRIQPGDEDRRRPVSDFRPRERSGDDGAGRFRTRTDRTPDPAPQPQTAQPDPQPRPEVQPSDGARDMRRNGGHRDRYSDD